MQLLFLSLVVISNLFQPQTTPEVSTDNICAPVETSSPTLQYPVNQTKSFLDKDEFYQQLDRTIYEEYNNATFSMRQKILFKDVPDAEHTFNVKTNHANDKMDLSNHTFIHPNRQVYFLASFYQNGQEEFHKFVVIDAETKSILLGGSHYHHYDNPYQQADSQ
ncbi:hypothetical protein [Lysinibacillus sphaericus]|uniref:Group-specific protein n=1 Tax=Lysinibacillus sphaericus OT4b.31 TaxID=1285586 RepID=R7ZF95_LYSSH|nr:hypothetical protein [Lysinibacillus sphaericus]EON72706.1 hypothetical protein H131_11213 [Lysinibacillus sphaericus OT4b.31]